MYWVSHENVKNFTSAAASSQRTLALQQHHMSRLVREYEVARGAATETRLGSDSFSTPPLKASQEWASHPQPNMPIFANDDFGKNYFASPPPFQSDWCTMFNVKPQVD